MRINAATFASRTITGTSNKIDVTNGDGVAGNPTLTISPTYVGQASITTVGTVTTGTWSGLFGAVTGANLTNLTAANISAGTAGINITGNAATATALQTARLINGVSFNGTADITVTSAAGTLSGTTLNATVVTSSLTTVGTIGTGVWQGTIVAGQYGGTGVANTGKTITIGGNFTTSGAFTTALTVTANTAVTLPTTGTLATLAGTENLSNKTIVAGVLDTNTTATTQAVGDTSTKIATTAFVTNSTRQIAPITASVAANALTVTLNPINLDFRSATLGSGAVNSRSVGSAISVVVPSAATLGTVNAIQSRIMVLAIDNAGTVELAVVNINGGNDLTETGVISTTAISAAATSPSVIYSTAARTNVPYRVVGYVESTQATAGTWATAPSTIQGVGGQAITAMSSIGYGQSWQSVTRTAGTTYYNTTGRPITLLSYSNATAANLVTNSQISINGGALIVFVGVGAASNGSGAGSIIIPPSASYVMTDVNCARTNYELR